MQQIESNTAVDLVLLDVMIPYVDGTHLLERIRAMPSWENIPIIMLTAKSGERDIASALNLGADDFISKPFKPLELIARIKHRLKQKNDLQVYAVVVLIVCLATVNPALGNETTAWQKAMTAADRKQWDEARIQLDIWLQERSDDAEALFMLARILSWQGKYDQSAATYETLLHKYPAPTICSVWPRCVFGRIFPVKLSLC